MDTLVKAKEKINNSNLNNSNINNSITSNCKCNISPGTIVS